MNYMALLLNVIIIISIILLDISILAVIRNNVNCDAGNERVCFAFHRYLFK